MEFNLLVFTPNLTRFSRFLFLISALLFLSSFSSTCEEDCISIEQNTSENIIIIELADTESRSDQLLLFNEKNEQVLSENIWFQNERTILYIDLNTIDLPIGEYTVKFLKSKLNKEFLIS